MNNTNKLTAFQTTIIVAVAIYMVIKATVEVSVQLGKLTYSLGLKAGQLYFNSKYYNPIVSEVVEALTIEAKEVRVQFNNYVLGWALFVSLLHSLYLDTLIQVELLTIKYKLILHNFINNEKVIALSN